MRFLPESPVRDQAELGMEPCPPVHIHPPGASSKALVTLSSVMVALKKQIHKELLHTVRLRVKLRAICFSFIIHALYTTYFPKGLETAYNNRHL